MTHESTPTSDGHFVTQLLDQVRLGETGARDKLVDAVYHTLRQIAEHQKRYIGSQTLDAEALVSEAYFKVLGQENVDFENRRHLYGAFSRAMREILIDAARRRNAQKRGGDRQRVPLDDIQIMGDAPVTDVIALDRLITQLESTDPRAAEVIRFRFFLGMAESQIAEVLGVTVRTVQRDWTYARAFMRRELRSGETR
ncbi:MAG TPA: sigma-70 family RNA polymerase sigma factor [Phycisphaerales bacterium]|nr:sigma-70 family RNA polymerase sigma factor [Phycisphaerales bacterium]